MPEVNPKIKKLIIDRLDDQMRDKIIMPYGEEFWVIDEDNSDWVFIYKSDGKLSFNQDFFKDYFYLFSVKLKQFQRILQNWFETKFKLSINGVSRKQCNHHYYLVEITVNKNKKWELNNRFGFGYEFIRKYLTHSKYGYVYLKSFVFSDESI